MNAYPLSIITKKSCLCLCISSLYHFLFLTYLRNKRAKYKKNCPICGKENLTDLVKHLQSKRIPNHQLDHQSALDLSFKLRKPYELKDKQQKPKTNNYHVPLLCTYDGCNRIVANPSDHLKGYHKKSDPEERKSILLKMREPSELKVLTTLIKIL